MPFINYYQDDELKKYERGEGYSKEMRNTCKILVTEPERKTALGRPGFM
jgi:hypothetical protein